MIGAGWGVTEPLSKIAVSTGYLPFGLIFWQLAIGSGVMAVFAWGRGKRLPLTPEALRIYAIIAVIGTLLPNAASYETIRHIPAGVMAILMSLIPMAAFPMALGLGVDRFSWRRLFGLLAGLGGVLLLALPETSLPDPAMILWIPLGLVAVICYAFEGNFVARWGTAGLTPVQVLFGASVLGSLMVLPVAVVSGQFIVPTGGFGPPEWALIASSVIHVFVYAAYVWLVGRAGAVFTVQVSYLVTGFGVFWSMLILGERYSGYIWAAFACVMLGIFLVQPRRQDMVASA
ncbi:MAG: DMT family transporter [Marinibacterium sp.]|nr:DMT family transporter [Marinibacterium sp.]